MSSLSALGCLLVAFLGFRCLAIEVTSTGISLTPREYDRSSHSITLDFNFALLGFAAFTVLWLRGMENGMGCVFLHDVIMRSSASGRCFGRFERKVTC